jgi:hypothetical protein
VGIGAHPAIFSRGEIIMACADGNAPDSLGQCADGSYAAGPLIPTSGSGDALSSFGSFNFGGLSDLFGSISKAIALDYSAITKPTSNIQALPGGGYVVNGQIVQGQAPLGGLFGNTSSSPLIIIAIVIGAIFLLKR